MTYTIERGGDDPPLDTSPDILVKYNEKMHAVIVTWRPDMKAVQPIGLQARWLESYKWSIPALDAKELLNFFSTFHKDKRVSFDPSAASLIHSQLEREATTTTLALAEDGDVPDVLSIKLRNFQRAAVAYMLRGSPRKLIALPTGTGKTSVANAYAQLRKTRTLWITTASLVLNLKREIKKLTGQQAVILRGTQPTTYDLELLKDQNYQHFIISYDSISRGLLENEETEQTASLWAMSLVHFGKFGLLVVDEAHGLRNRGTKRYKAIKDLASIPSIALLTATPLINKGTDYFSLLHILDSKTFGSEQEFTRAYLSSDGKYIANNRKLQADLLPFMFTRKREQIQKDLPPKIRDLHLVQLDENWKAEYQSVLEGIYRDLQGVEKDVPDFVLAQINRFRQVVSHAKMSSTVDFARKLEEDGEKTLIFTAWKDTAYHLGKELFCDVITGDVKQEERMTMQDRFNNDPTCKHLVLMFQVGGQGLNLTGGTALINNDFCWTPAEHDQAEGRAWGRLNDPHGLLVYSIAVEGSVDQEMMKVLERKQRLIDEGQHGQRQYLEANKSMLDEFVKFIKRGR